MNQSIGLVAVVVRDYDEALGFYVGTLGFRLIEDTPIPAQENRWVVVVSFNQLVHCRQQTAIDFT
jgi:catechol 2,3-dioxygenase-like lactoylglutathione lyase family enzyme